MTLEIENISKTVNGIQILNNIKFAVPKGTLTILSGHNGAGKSTLLRILGCLTRPTRGSIVWQSKPCTYDSSYRKVVGYSGHELMLYENLTVRENLLLFARLYNVKDFSDEIERLEKSIGFMTYIDQAVAELSKGMKQKASIARALMHRPEIVILDEPLTGLDIKTQEKVVKFIKELLIQEKYIIIALHDVDRFISIAHQIVVLKKGSVSQIEFPCEDTEVDQNRKIVVSGGRV
ncbi:MAG: hypothetical protein APF76_00690 [Desulfitibacter sp. BRH_c19]|nr:MAG: hypothetical protein APF76_00690 [Desulfitibacter sp. BRH_c19]